MFALVVKVRVESLLIVSESCVGVRELCVQEGCVGVRVWAVNAPSFVCVQVLLL